MLHKSKRGQVTTRLVGIGTTLSLFVSTRVAAQTTFNLTPRPDYGRTARELAPWVAGGLAVAGAILLVWWWLTYRRLQRTQDAAVMKQFQRRFPWGLAFLIAGGVVWLLGWFFTPAYS